jgi:hypothetical protein
VDGQHHIFHFFFTAVARIVSLVLYIEFPFTVRSFKSALAQCLLALYKKLSLLMDLSNRVFTEIR